MFSTYCIVWNRCILWCFLRHDRFVFYVNRGLRPTVSQSCVTFLSVSSSACQKQENKDKVIFWRHLNHLDDYSYWTYNSLNQPLCGKETSDPSSFIKDQSTLDHETYHPSLRYAWLVLEYPFRCARCTDRRVGKVEVSCFGFWMKRYRTCVC
jgi:hypothetical protein